MVGEAEVATCSSVTLEEPGRDIDCVRICDREAGREGLLSILFPTTSEYTQHIG